MPTTMPPIRPLSDGEELVLAEDTPFNSPEREADPNSAALKRRNEASSAPSVPSRPQRRADAGL